MKHDPLSDVLSALKPHTYVAGGLNLGGDWSLAFDAHSGIKCYAVISGSAWLTVEGLDGPLRLESGDCVLLPSGRTFILSQDLALPPQPFSDIPREDWMSGFAVINGGGGTMMVAGHFAFAWSHVEMLLGTMPTIIQLRDAEDKEGMRWVLERMQRELASNRPGGVLVAQHLAHLVLIQALRLSMNQFSGKSAGWLFALADPRMAAAIGAIHADPGAPWTLLSLASEAGMSRSKFAARFKATTGSAPMEYLTRWRMLLACDRLIAGKSPIASLAETLGYASESAFSIAFKRVIGDAPRQFARRHAVNPCTDQPVA